MRKSNLKGNYAPNARMPANPYAYAVTIYINLMAKPFVKGDKHKCFILGEDTETFGKGTKMIIPTTAEFFEQLKGEFYLTPSGCASQYQALSKYDAEENKTSFCANNLVYYYYWEGLMKTRYKGGKTLLEIYDASPEKYWERVCKMDRRKRQPPLIRDAWELNRAITFFKPTTAKHIVERFCPYGGKVFDPCAGWGGRLLGTLSAGCEYYAHDTNSDIIETAKTMISDLEGQGCEFRKWNISHSSCLELTEPEELRTLENKFDFAFTSPPYSNLEVYEEMTPFVDDDDYYKNFLIPMIDRCRLVVKEGGTIAINVSPKIYKTLTERYEYELSAGQIDFKQQIGQATKAKGGDFFYLWFAR